MPALMNQKYYVFSGALQVVILGETAEDAAVKAVSRFGTGKVLGNDITVTQSGFVSGYNGLRFITQEILDKV